MIPVEFDYKKASSLQNAFELLAGGDAKLLSGGHSLVPAMKLRLNQPAVVVDISKIASLKGIKKNGDTLVIGGTTTHTEIATSDLVNTHLKLLAEGAKSIGDTQVRNRGTLGGSLAHADPSADWPALVLATDATIVCEPLKPLIFSQACIAPPSTTARLSPKYIFRYRHKARK
jgi:aerobic carbon-monoxide dehydrogenase medium subunit